MKWILYLEIVKVYWLIEFEIEPNGGSKGEQFWVFWKSELIDCFKSLIKWRFLRKTNFCLKSCFFTCAEDFFRCYKKGMSSEKKFSLKFGLSAQLGRRHCKNNVPNWTIYLGKRLYTWKYFAEVLQKQLLSHGAYPFSNLAF